MRSISLLVAVGILLSGCVVSNTTKLTSNSYPPVPAERVTIYLSEADIPGEFIKIGLINAKGNHGWTNEEQMLNKMRVDAGKMGANGILYASIDEPGAGAKIAGAVLGVGVNRRGQVIAILVQDERTGSLETLAQRQEAARESMPAERQCANAQDGLNATLYKATQDRTPIVNTTGGRAETLAMLDAGDYVLRIDSFGKFEKVCFGNTHGWVKKELLEAG